MFGLTEPKNVSMMINKDYGFFVNVSSDAYENKKDALESIATLELAKKNGHSQKMSFNEVFTNLDFFEGLILSGHSYCGGIFRFPDDYKETFSTKTGGKYTTTPFYKDGSLKAQFKTDENFTFGQVFSIDIDGTRFNDPEAYVSTLSLTPSLYYTSPSDDPGGLRRFRLIYIIDTPLNKEAYDMATRALHRMIEEDTLEKIKDTCGERYSQYFNGNKNGTSWKTYNILSPSDLMPFIKKFNIGPKEEEKEPENLFTPSLIKDMETLGYDKFMHFYSLRFRYYWSSVDFEDGSEYKVLEPGKDIVLLFRWNGRYLDGEGRRKRLQKYAELRRIARPSVSPDELLFNLYIDRERFFDNSDNVLTLECLMRKVELAFSRDINELRENYKDLINKCPVKFVVNPNVILKQKIINKDKKELRWAEIDKNYDATKSLKENLEILKSRKIKIEKTTLYEYCREKGISTRPDADDKRKRILALYDSSRSQKENLNVLKENGIEITRQGMMRIIKNEDSSSPKEVGSSNDNAGINMMLLMLSNIIL